MIVFRRKVEVQEDRYSTFMKISKQVEQKSSRFVFVDDEDSDPTTPYEFDSL